MFLVDKSYELSHSSIWFSAKQICLQNLLHIFAELQDEMFTALGTQLRGRRFLQSDTS